MTHSDVHITVERDPGEPAVQHKPVLIQPSTACGPQPGLYVAAKSQAWPFHKQKIRSDTTPSKVLKRVQQAVHSELYSHFQLNGLNCFTSEKLLQSSNTIFYKSEFQVTKWTLHICVVMKNHLPDVSFCLTSVFCVLHVSSLKVLLLI